ncbi:MAG: lipopolysaccharide heptosyltransferase II [Acidobacteria bacterium]|nr:lipopolysaccharide heptosyltransferase II [Acidobacteriota bacterium]MBU1474474.1 lipopolysaccharide heptosyltransferase II [Acidobacteriota bacterium]MBU4328920.1 lipopolysaccharide heptosyltransferase II [Acidobacteriota bacterium]MCG2816776.1 lipopolysaccharide heptosyltransferase II [Candidatus Aminicenantes bacterium]
MKKICIRVPNWLGDAVMALPSIRCLHRSFQGDELWLAGPDWILDLYRRQNFAAHCLFTPSTNSAREQVATTVRIREIGFDSVLFLTNSFRSVLPFFRARTPERCGYNRDGRFVLLSRGVRPPGFLPPLHQVNEYLHLLSRLSFPVGESRVFLDVPDSDRADADEILKRRGVDRDGPLVALSPGAFYGMTKQWPNSKFSELGRLFQERDDARICIVGSSRDKEPAEEIVRSLPRMAVNLAGETNLPQLAALIKLCRLFISNDSGPMHLANAVGTPVVSIFGPTDERRTGPFQQPSAVVKKQAPCGPCLYRTCPYDHRCMNDITAEDVYSIGRTFLP